MDTEQQQYPIHVWKRILTLSFLVVIAAQFHISLFNNNFKISVGILCLPIFLFLLDQVPLVPVTIFSGLGVFLARMLYYYYSTHTTTHMFRSCYPEAFFYLVYGLLLYAYTKKENLFTKELPSPLPFFLMDYAANLAELLLRREFPTFTWSIQLGIASVAAVRAMLTVGIIYLFKRYHLVLLRQEHANRYQRLLMLISRLSGEIIWMKKNTSLIEDTMNMSYQLYGNLKEIEDLDPELSKSALQVARDIHEIKKEYNLILRGISDALHWNLQDDGMYMEELLEVLETAMQEKAAMENKKLVFTYQIPPKIYTEKHYFLLSILRNLVTNAIEASDQMIVTIHFSMTREEGFYRLSVQDDGPGISRDHLEHIFEPGFSTKINYETGEISRGLGLNLVKDLVVNQFHGSIQVTSLPGCTTFLMILPIPIDKEETTS